MDKGGSRHRFLMNEEMRYRTEQVPLTLGQRADIWWKGIVDAIRSKPETHWTRWVLVKKGEAGYEDAPWGCITDPNPLRYKYENGKWVEVDMTEAATELNPSWVTPDE